MQNPLAEKKRGLPTKLGAQLTGTTDKAAGGGVGKRCTRSEDCDLSERERERGETVVTLSLRVVSLRDEESESEDADVTLSFLLPDLRNQGEPA